MITRVFILLCIIPSFIFSQEYKVYDRSENTIIPEVNFYNNKHAISERFSQNGLQIRIQSEKPRISIRITVKFDLALLCKNRI